MKMRSDLFRFALIGAVVVSAGCNQGKLRETEQRLAAAEARVNQMNQIAAEKDTLMSELIATTTFINQVNDEMAKIKPAKGAKTVTYKERVMPVAEYRAAMLTRVRELGKRIDDAETRLATAQERIRVLTSKDRDATQRLAMFDSMVVQYRTMIADQRTQIEQLTSQLDTLQAEKTRLVFEKAALDSTVTDLTTEANTVFFVAGSKKELIARGVAREEGGSRVLGIFGRTGRTLVPAREVDDSMFTTLDKRTALEITFPKADKPYSIVSPHSTKFIDPQPDKDGKIRGGKITITDPQAFWEQSKYLIVVER